MEYQPIERETPTGKAAPNPKNQAKTKNNLNVDKLTKSFQERNLSIVKKEVKTLVETIEKKEKPDGAEKAMNKVQQQKLVSLLQNVISTVNNTNSLLKDGLKEIATTKNNSISDIAIGLQHQGKLKVTIEIG